MKKELIKNIKKMLPYLKKCKKDCIGYLIFSILEIVIGIIIPLVSAQLIVSLTNSMLKQAILISLAILITKILSNFAIYFKEDFYMKINEQTLENIQIDIARQALNINQKYIEKETTGMFIERLNNDPDDVADLFAKYVYWITTVLGNIGVLITIFILNKTLFLFDLIFAIVMFYINNKRIIKQDERRKKVRKINEVKTGLTTEIIHAIKDIKQLNLKESTLKLSKTNIHESVKEEVNIYRIESIFDYLIGDTFENILEFIFILISVYLLKNNLLSITSFFIIFNYQTKVKYLLIGLSYVVEFNKKFILSANRIFEIIDGEKYPKEKFGVKNIKNIKGNIEFKNVDFAYDERNILNDISFNVKHNEKIAFVGKSGSGKTTIFNLLTALYSNYNGNIYIDGYDIKDLSCDSIRNNIAIVNQNPYLFNFSIKENLMLVDENLTLDEIRNACKLAHIDSFIMGLPMQYDTKLGENGMILSGGEKQRLAIARAILKKSKIILFDEATSALDNITQNEIKNSINNLNNNATILIIAHRLSTIIDCDKIYLLDDGKIVDSGTHDELLESSKLYRELYKNLH